MKCAKTDKGFALIELMVIVAILSMASAFFVPRFLKHRIQQKQQECRKNLESLYAAEKEYFQKTGRFTTDVSILAWAPQGYGIYQYRFRPTPSPQTQKASFLFECSGNIDKDPTLDEAQIDETGRFIQLRDDTQK